MVREASEKQIDYYIPSTFRRIFASWLDDFAISFFSFPIAFKFFVGIYSGSTVQITWSWILIFLLLSFLYHFLFLYYLGATPGKLLMGLRVVDIYKSSALTLWQSLIRALSKGLTFFFGYSLYAFMFFKYNRTHAIDWIAETKVVQLIPRTNVKKTRPILALILILFFTFNTISKLMNFTQYIKFSTQGIEVNPASLSK